MTMKNFTLAIIAAFTLSACTLASLSARHDLAQDLARGASMKEEIIPAGVFQLTTFQRVTQADAPVNVYIEGDGLAWINSRTPSLNPTPPNPTALRLAVADKAENVVYIARPCQFSGWNGNGACPDIYWTNGRTSADVIHAYNQALDALKTQYHVASFNLIGYSGGAAVAALLASERTDILSLRTVAGNTDYAAFSALHGVSPLNASRDPVEAATKIAKLPQYHFIGSDDKIVTPVIFDGWKKASGDGACLQSQVVTGVSHEDGWAAKWPELMQLPLPCVAPAVVPAATAPVTGPPPLGTL